MSIRKRIVEYLVPEAKENNRLQYKLQALASIVDWSQIERQSLNFGGAGDSGNDYVTYSTATRELALKYDGNGDWGNQFASIIIDTRAAAIAGGGITWSVPEGRTVEHDFIERLLDFNKLDDEGIVNIAVDGEIEGKIVMLLKPDKDDDGPIPAIRFLSWTQNEYDLITDGDYLDIKGISWYVNKVGQQRTIRNTDEFVYMKLAGRTTKVDETRSKAGKVLMEMENADRAVKDLRKIDHLFASPTPYMEVASKKRADSTTTTIGAIKWKIGKFFSGTGKFSFVSAPMEGAEMLTKEVVLNLQMLSGGTGVPPHWLGFPDLMSNRATAENLMDLIAMATKIERQVHIGGWKEVIEKAMLMQSRLTGKFLNPEGLMVDMPFVTAAQLQELVDVWMPLNEGGYVSRETVMAKVPGIDVEDEMEKIDEEKEENIKKFGLPPAPGTTDDDDEDIIPPRIAAVPGRNE